MPVPAIPLIMTGATLLKGILDSGKAAGAERQASDLAKGVMAEDPGTRSYLNDIVARRNYAEAGATRMNSLKRRDIEQAGVQTGANLRRASGGSAGTTIDALLRSQNMTERNLAQAGAETEALAPQYLGMQAPLVSDMADRRLSLQTYGRDQAAARAARYRSDANQNLMASMGVLAGLDYSAQAPTDAMASAPTAQPQGAFGSTWRTMGAGGPSGIPAALNPTLYSTSNVPMDNPRAPILSENDWLGQRSPVLGGGMTYPTPVY